MPLRLPWEGVEVDASRRLDTGTLGAVVKVASWSILLAWVDNERKKMSVYKINYADGSTNTIIADLDFVRANTSEGDTYAEVLPPDPTDHQKESSARVWRDRQLLDTDFIVPLTDHPQRDAYITYRQKLRDWPSTSDFPNTKPTVG